MCLFNCPHWHSVTLLHSLIERGNTYFFWTAFSEWLFLPYIASYYLASWTAQSDGQLWEIERRRCFSQSHTQQLMLRSGWEAPLHDGAHFGIQRKAPEAFSSRFYKWLWPQGGFCPHADPVPGLNAAAWAHITHTLLTISPAAWGYDALVTLT